MGKTALWFAVGGGLAALYLLTKKGENTSTPATNQSTTMDTTLDTTALMANQMINQMNKAAKVYTMKQVSQHGVQDGTTDPMNSDGQIWTTINGNVYNITKWIPQHPGGPIIYQIAGKDGTVLFNQMHSTKTKKANAKKYLKEYFIGTLKK